MINNRSVSKVEILTAIVIVGVLAFIAVPKFLDVLKKSKEAATKKGLYSLRSAIVLYYGDNGGKYPGADIAKELVEKGYIQEIPYVYVPHHKKSNSILTHDIENKTDIGGWAYKVDDTADSTGRAKGQIWINCFHNDWSKL